MKTKLIAIVLAAVCSPHLHAQPLPYQDTRLSAEARAADLCQRLTLEEKSQLMRNASPAIPRLGIPPFEWWSEALHGTARNGYATVFPITMGMAASWDDCPGTPGVCRRERRVAHQEHPGQAHGQHQALPRPVDRTPNINIFRDPRWGRGQETYGEDPYLTARMGLAWWADYRAGRQPLPQVAGLCQALCRTQRPGVEPPLVQHRRPAGTRPLGDLPASLQESGAGGWRGRGDVCLPALRRTALLR